MAGQRGEDDNDGDYEGMVRRSLAAADPLGALYQGYRALRAAMAKEHRRRPAVAGLTAAELGGQLLGLAGELSSYKPRRPRGCPPVPRPDDLLAAFDRSLREARGEH